MKTKQCRGCGKEKTLTEFYKYYSRGYGPYYFSWCLECQRKRNLENKQHNKLQNQKSKRDWDYQKKYGITLAQFELMLKSQNGVCAICGQPETAKRKNGTIQPLAMDHDHKTGITRELLCSNCNPMLGYAKDDPEILEKAAAYLRKHRKKIEKALNGQHTVTSDSDSN